MKKKNSEVNETPFLGVSCADAFLAQRALRFVVPVSPMLLVLSSCNGSAGSTGFVEDRAGLLTEDQRVRIDRFSRQLFEELGIQLKTVILKESPADINATAVELFDRLRLGGTTRGAKGVLFLIDPAGKQVRLEIGYDLEGVFTDAFIGYVERRQMTPFSFRLGPDGWMIDFAAMHRSLGFNHKNQWFFRTPEHDFKFAFNDMVFDRNGFPHKRP